jgi:hypothetical protein
MDIFSPAIIIQSCRICPENVHQEKECAKRMNLSFEVDRMGETGRQKTLADGLAGNEKYEC